MVLSQQQLDHLFDAINDDDYNDVDDNEVVPSSHRNETAITNDIIATATTMMTNL